MKQRVTILVILLLLVLTAPALIPGLAGNALLLYASQQKSPPMTMQSQDANASMQQAIQDKFNNDLNFAETRLTATVTGDTVVLRGNVRSVGDHQKALEIAKSLANGRWRIVDETTIQQVYRRGW
jgi:osmotically-inducible protein OsmY